MSAVDSAEGLSKPVAEQVNGNCVDMTDGKTFEEKPVYSISYDSTDSQISICGVEETVITQQTAASEVPFTIPEGTNDEDRPSSGGGTRTGPVVETVDQVNIDQTEMDVESIICDTETTKGDISEYHDETSNLKISSEVPNVDIFGKIFTNSIRSGQSSNDNEGESSHGGDQICSGTNFQQPDDIKRADVENIKSDIHVSAVSSIDDSSVTHGNVVATVSTSPVANQPSDRLTGSSSGAVVVTQATVFSSPMSPNTGKHHMPQMLVQKRPGTYQVLPSSQVSKLEKSAEEGASGPGIQPLKIRKQDGQSVVIVRQMSSGGAGGVASEAMGVSRSRSLSSGSSTGHVFNVVTTGSNVVRGKRSTVESSTGVLSLLRCQSTTSTGGSSLLATSAPGRTILKVTTTKNAANNFNSAAVKVVTATSASTAAPGLLKISSVVGTSTVTADNAGSKSVLAKGMHDMAGSKSVQAKGMHDMAGSKSVLARGMYGMAGSKSVLTRGMHPLAVRAAQPSCGLSGHSSQNTLSLRPNNPRSISFGTVPTGTKFISQLVPGNKIQLSVLKPSSSSAQQQQQLEQQQTGTTLDSLTTQSLKVRSETGQGTVGIQEPAKQTDMQCTVTVIRSNSSSSVLTTSAYQGMKSQGTVWKTIRPSTLSGSVVAQSNSTERDTMDNSKSNTSIIKPTSLSVKTETEDADNSTMSQWEEGSSSSSGGTASASERKLKRKALGSMPDDNDPEDVRAAKSPCLATDAALLAVTVSSKNESKRGSGNKKKNFSWDQYLTEENAIVAPPEIFRIAFPATRMGFRAGMKLEGIDPKHPYLYCVLSVKEVKGYRMRLHFDHYSECHDFWVNGDCSYIFPPGWAEKNGKRLQPPRSLVGQGFDWTSYMKICSSTNCIVAPKNLFPNLHLMERILPGVRVGMKLEAVDKKSTSLTCVATVADILGDKILVHFDGWESVYDYWADMSSPYIHPVGWCQDNAKPISPPNDWEDISSFTWEEYLELTNSLPLPNSAFKPRGRNKFKVGQRLEAVDRRNPLFVRVASIACVEDYRVKIHFDGWSDVYDFWEDDDSADIHPAGWCYKTGHVLTPPLSQADLLSYPTQGNCPTPGCTGVGHIKGAMYAGHHSAFGCPYSSVNLQKEFVLADRLSNSKLNESSSQHNLTVSIKAPRGQTPTSLSPSDNKKVKSSTGSNSSGYNTFRQSSQVQYLSPSSASTISPSLCLASTNGREAFQNGGGASGEHEGVKEEPLERQKATLKLNLQGLTSDSKPLVGPGSGRGRKKKKILRLIQKQKELEASVAEAQSGLLRGIHQSIFMSSTASLKASMSDAEVERLTSRGEEALKKDLPPSWKYLERLLPEVSSFSSGSSGSMEVSDWTVKDVARFISHLTGCASYAKTIYEQQVDGESLLLLTQADIVDIMKIKLGPAVKIYNSIMMLKDYTASLSSFTPGAV